MSTLVAGLVILGTTLLATLLLHIVITKRVSLNTLTEHNEVAASFLHVTGGMYGILLAFVVSLVWETNEQTRRTVAEEANSAATMVRVAPGLASPKLREDAVAYMHAVIDDEWPRLARGGMSRVAEDRIDDMWHTVTSYEPKTEGQRNVHQQALSDMRALGDERRLRLYESQRRLPPLVWGTIIFGGAIILGLANVFGLRFRVSKALMITGLAVSLALIGFTVRTLEHPFSGGAGGITPEDFRRALDIVQERPAPLAQDPIHHH